MGSYKAEDFNFSRMSEKLTFMEQNNDGTYSDLKTVWGHVLKDGFIRSETDNFFKLMVREQKALKDILANGNRIKWGNRTLMIRSWQNPSFEKRGFIEILAKQIITDEPGSIESAHDKEMFSDIVSVFKLTTVATTSFGVTSYEYDYDFANPDHEGVRCEFHTDRNKYVYDKTKDVEHDSTIVYFSMNAPVSREDYIESPHHGRFKIDMLVKNDENMLEAHVKRTEVQ